MYGLVAAYIASAIRLGWTIVDAVHATMDHGTALDFSIDPPAFGKAAVAESGKRWRWRGNGKRLQGYVPADRFEKMLEENSRS